MGFAIEFGRTLHNIAESSAPLLHHVTEFSTNVRDDGGRLLRQSARPVLGITAAAALGYFFGAGVGFFIDDLLLKPIVGPDFAKDLYDPIRYSAAGASSVVAVVHRRIFADVVRAL